MLYEVITGNLIEKTSAEEQIVYQYDDENHLTRVETSRYGATIVVEYAYDADGNLSSRRSPAVVGTPNGNDFPDGKQRYYSYSGGTAGTRLAHNLTSIADQGSAPGGDPDAVRSFLTATYSAATSPAARNNFV